VHELDYITKIQNRLKKEREAVTGWQHKM